MLRLDTTPPISENGTLMVMVVQTTFPPNAARDLITGRFSNAPTITTALHTTQEILMRSFTGTATTLLLKQRNSRTTFENTTIISRSCLYFRGDRLIIHTRLRRKNIGRCTIPKAFDFAPMSPMQIRRKHERI